MKNRFLLFVLVGIAVVCGAVAWIFYGQRGGHMELTGSVLKVRTLATDENSAVALVDFRVTNSSDYVWMVRSVSLSIVDGQGHPVEGYTISDVDTTRLFGYFPLLGPKYNESLTLRARIQSHQTVDRMIGARFEVPEAQVLARQSLKIHIEEVDGGASDIQQGPAATP